VYLNLPFYNVPLSFSFLQDIPCEHPVVIIKGMKPSDLQHVIQYMYFGEVRLLQDEIDDFIEAAESLKVEGLTFFEKESAIHYAVSAKF